PNPNPGTWISLDMPLSSWTSGIRNDLAQFIISSNLGVVYVDNIYLYKGTSLGTTKFETSNVKMYPNPIRNNLTIEANGTIEKVSVYNILGQEVLTTSPNTTSATIQTTSLQKGVYIVKTEIDGKLSASKMVKE
ncbi:MAG TPA: T9SS type A sorting domain-containing protein, partial [Flavobacterium sp.]|uniref:T9SS type A sorting domain-containing protein n=1 Tax=Flavobacterium sp. TaxID=239 RepID=UPI002F4219B2